MAASIRELSQRRAIQAMGEQIAGSVHDHAVGPSVLLTDAARSVDDLLAKCRPAGKTLWTTAEAAENMLSAIGNDQKDVRILTGLDDLDRPLGGLRRREAILLGGRPSMGKTAAGVVVGRRVARFGHGVLVLSLEMSADQWMARMLTDACWSRDTVVAYSAALRGELRERERQIFERTAKELGALPILIEEQSGLTAADIASRTRHAAELFGRQGKRLGLVIVDHLGKVRPSSRYKGQKVHEVAEISEAMAHLAKTENVAVFALHQLNRAVEGRDNKRPQLSDLRESGNLEQDADVVLFAYRSAYYLERAKGETPELEAKRIANLDLKRNKLELLIAKQRHGPICTVELYCDMAANAIRDKRVAG